MIDDIFALAGIFVFCLVVLSLFKITQFLLSRKDQQEVLRAIKLVQQELESLREEMIAQQKKQGTSRIKARAMFRITRRLVVDKPAPILESNHSHELPSLLLMAPSIGGRVVRPTN